MQELATRLADHSVGTWKLNTAKSITTPPGADHVESLTVVYEAMDGGVKITVTGETDDGKPIAFDSAVKYDGKEYPITGAPYDIIRARQIDENTISFEDRKSDGVYHTFGWQVISRDGRTMTLTISGTGCHGEPVSQTTFYDRQ